MEGSAFRKQSKHGFASVAPGEFSVAKAQEDRGSKRDDGSVGEIVTHVFIFSDYVVCQFA